MTRLVLSTRLTRNQKRPGRVLRRNGPRHDLRRHAQRSQRLRPHKLAVSVVRDRRRLGFIHGDIGQRCRVGPHLQPIRLVVLDRSGAERHHREAGGRRVHHACGCRPRSRRRVDQAVKARRLGARGIQRVVLVEVNVDHIPSLRQHARSRIASDRLRHDRDDLRPEVHLEPERLRCPQRLGGCSQPRRHPNLVRVVQQRLREPDHHFILVWEVVPADIADLHLLVSLSARPAKRIVEPAAAPHRNVRCNRPRADGAARAEPQRDLLRVLRQYLVTTQEVVPLRALERRHEVECEHLSRFEAFHIAGRPAGPQGFRTSLPRHAPRERVLNGRQPGSEKHGNRPLKTASNSVWEDRSGRDLVQRRQRAWALNGATDQSGLVSHPVVSDSSGWKQPTHRDRLCREEHRGAPAVSRPSRETTVVAERCIARLGRKAGYRGGSSTTPPA